MKSRTWMWMSIVSLFAALAVPVWTAAQDNASQNNRHQHHRYRLVDLGTLGGPNSYLNVASSVGNSNSIFVGQADTSTPAPQNTNPFNCFDPYVMNAFKWENGVLTNLHSLNGDENCSEATLIGSDGMFAGDSENGAVDPMTGLKEIRAVVWKDGAIVDLGTFGGNHSGAQGIVGHEQVVGFALNNTPDPFSFFDFFFLGFGNGTQTRAFLWKKGKGLQDLGTLGSGNDAFPFSANEGGQVAGAAYTNSTPNPTTGIPTVDPFLWESGRGMRDLGTLGGTIGLPNFLNNRGQVVGTSNLAGDNFAHGFLWSRGVLTDLGTFGGHNSSANSLNDAGEVVGVADFSGDQTHDAFLWRSGAMTDLGNLGRTSSASSINSQRQIVGASRIDDTGNVVAFLWENGGPMVDLNILIPSGSGVTLTEANSINDRGEIALQGNLTNGDTHAFLLIPCDENHPGRCEDYSMIETPTPQTAAPAKQLPAMAKQGSKTSTSPIERFRNQMRQRYHIPGRTAVPRD